MIRLMRHPELGALAAVIVIGAFFSVSTVRFASPGGVANWTDVASTIGIVSVAVALLMIAGEFDLSAGVMVGSAGLLVGILSTRLGVNLWVAVAAALGFAAAIGWLNGFVVVRTGLPSFIVTLATFFTLQGVNLGVTKLITDNVRVDGLRTVAGYEQVHAVFGGTFSTWDFRVSVLWWIVITVVAALLLKRTRAGNWIFAVGGDPAAARMMAVPVNRVKIGLFMATSMTAALVGIMVAARLGSVTATQGVGNEFMYIVCAVVGGTLLSGGYGSPVGASLGAVIVGMAFIGIQFSGWNTDWRFLFLGVILLLAVLVNNLVRRAVR
ncbi:MAG TPA: ABC transporter permease [Actinophytocola sp.]|nr:ABC transporter permease [Actinophytocola sp.]HEU5474346.1 ABC transporter permease [Actinophytocola sp.]